MAEKSSILLRKTLAADDFAQGRCRRLRESRRDCPVSRDPSVPADITGDDLLGSWIDGDLSREVKMNPLALMACE